MDDLDNSYVSDLSYAPPVNIVPVNASEMQGPTSFNPTMHGKASAVEEAKQWLQDMEYLYMRSFNELEAVFRSEFPESQAFKDMVIELNQNMIEFKFLHKAGIIKPT